MIAVILAGGYAKRLWPLTLDKPKVLLPIAGKPIIDCVVEKALRINPPVTKIIVSTNLRFQSQFEEWLGPKGYCNVELVPDNSTNGYEKIGAVKALSDIASTISEDFLVLAGDNLFVGDLDDLITFFTEKNSPIVALYHSAHFNEAKNGAIAIINEDKKIMDFIEKPKDPKTTLIGACIYAFPERIVTRLKEYVDLGLPQDEPGRFIEWLHKKEEVYGYMLKSNLWDIGTLESYREAENHFR